MTDPYASGIISTVLAWLTFVPTVIGIATSFIGPFTDTDNPLPKPLLLWLTVCLIVWSPIRYILFQIVMAETFMFQSVRAFFTTLMLGLYVPIVLMLLCALAFGPLVLIIFTGQKEQRVTRKRGLIVAVLAPFACALGLLLFNWALPLGASTVHWVAGEDIIRATNGPTYYIFKYVASPGAVLQFSDQVYHVTPGTHRDLLRVHVASVYLSKGAFARFVATAYPEGYKTLHGEAASPGGSSDPTSEDIATREFLDLVRPQLSPAEVESVRAMMVDPKHYPAPPPMTDDEKAGVLGLLQHIWDKAITDEELEQAKAWSRHYTDRTGRKPRKYELVVATCLVSLKTEYDEERGRCIIASIETHKPVVSARVTALGEKMVRLGMTSDAQRKAHLAQMKAEADGTPWTDESGHHYSPMTKEEAAHGLENVRLVRDNLSRYYAAMAEMIEP